MYNNPMNESKTGNAKAYPPRSPRHSIIMTGFDKLPQPTSIFTPSCAAGDLTPKIGGEDVMFYNDEYFQLVRQRFCIPVDIVESTDVVNWDNMKPSLGKGGDAMLFTPDRKYIVKELGSDHPTLLNITKAYVEHVCGDSLLVRFAFHFYRPANKKNYVIMNSWLPDSEDDLNTKGDHNNNKEDQYLEVYDLKGCADDKMMVRKGQRLNQVHKRCWNCTMKCHSTPERRDYKNAKVYSRDCKFMLHFAERKRLMSKIQSDAQFLRTQGLMDYSLIVGLKKCPLQVFTQKYLPRGGFSHGDLHGRDQRQPYYCVHDNQVNAYYVGIIDFLQFYNCGKKCAHHIKCCDLKPLATVHPSVYGVRFEDYFNQKFTVTKNETPSWLKEGGISDLEKGSSNGGHGGGKGGGTGGGSNSSGGRRLEKDFEALAVSNSSAAAEELRQDESTPVKALATGAAMFVAAAGLAAIEMGVLGGPKEDEAER